MPFFAETTEFLGKIYDECPCSASDRLANMCLDIIEESGVLFSILQFARKFSVPKKFYALALTLLYHNVPMCSPLCDQPVFYSRYPIEKTCDKKVAVIRVSSRIHQGRIFTSDLGRDIHTRWWSLKYTSFRYFVCCSNCFIYYILIFDIFTSKEHILST